MGRLSEINREEYERIVKWVSQLNTEFDNNEVMHSQLLEEAREIGVAVVGLCKSDGKSWISLFAK